MVADIGREPYEVPVGFKWFVPGFHQGWLALGGEASAGASCLLLGPWSADKEDLLLCLLAERLQ